MQFRTNVNVTTSLFEFFIIKLKKKSFLFIPKHLPINGESNLIRSISHPYNHIPHKHLQYHHDHHPQQQQQHQKSHLLFPYMNFNGNVRKKPTQLSYNNNMLAYNKRYKRYPAYQAMPEIPIKKAINRYFPYSSLYQMGVIHAVTPSILIPLYMTPAKSSARMILKPASMFNFPSTTKIKPIPTTSTVHNNIVPVTDFNKQMLYNYMNLIIVNSTKPTHQLTIMPTVMSTALSHNIGLQYKSTTTTTPVPKPVQTMRSQFQVQSKIKILDSPFSASNLRQYQIDNTHYHLPTMPPALTTMATSTATSLATTTNTINWPTSSSPPSSPTTIATYKFLPFKNNHGKAIKIENDLDFVPTWYPYIKQQKHSNFFTIEDAITPYKPIEPITAHYNALIYNPQIEPTLKMKSSFTPIQNIFTTYALNKIPTAENLIRTTPAATTAISFIDELDKEISKWQAVEEKSEKENFTPWYLKHDEENNFTPFQIYSPNNSNTNPDSTTEHFMTIHSTDKPIPTIQSNSHQLGVFLPENITITLTDNFFLNEVQNISTELNAKTTIATKLIDKLPHKLKWPKILTKTHTIKSQAKIMETTTQATLLTTHATGVAKQPRKKFPPKYKNHRRTQNNTVNMEKLNVTTKIPRRIPTKNRIKKILRLRPTLLPLIKLRNNATKTNMQNITMMKANEENETSATENLKFIKELTTTSTTTTSTMPSPSSSSSLLLISTILPTKSMTYRSEQSQANHRKRGQYTYNNRKFATAETVHRNNLRSSIEMSQHTKQKKMRNVSRQRVQKFTNTTIANSSTVKPPTPVPILNDILTTNKSSNINRKRADHIQYAPSASSTIESAIMKIANNFTIAKNKKIHNILDNLLVSSSTTTLSKGLQSSTEIPPLPIELYFQKIKTGFQ